MASREFSVKARITADTKDAERNTRALAKANEELAKKLTDLKAKFDSGSISATTFATRQASIERQAARVARALSAAGDGAGSATGGFKRLGDYLSQRLVVTFGDVARAAEVAFNTIRQSAQRANQETAVRAQIEDFDAYIAKLREVSQETVSNAQLIAASSKALLLGIPAEKISELLEIARGAAAAMGLTVEEAFNRVTLAVGKASPELLDELGIVTRLGEANRNYAEQLGKSVDQLTAAERSHALLNEVISKNLDTYRVLANVQNDTSIAIEQGTAALDDFKTKAGEVATGLATGLAAVLTRSAQGFIALTELMIVLSKEMIPLAQRIFGFAVNLDGAQERAQSLSNQLGIMRRELGETADGLSRAADAALSHSTGLTAIFGASEKTTAAVGRVRREIERSAVAQEEAAKSSAALATAQDGVAESAEGAATASGNAATETVRWSSALQEFIPVTSVVNTEVGRMRSVFRGVREETLLTASAFDELAAAQGRAVATAAAVAAGGALSSNGRRVTVRGGSKLTNSPGLGGRSINYTTLGSRSVDAGGTL